MREILNKLNIHESLALTGSLKICLLDNVVKVFDCIETIRWMEDQGEVVQSKIDLRKSQFSDINKSQDFEGELLFKTFDDTSTGEWYREEQLGCNYMFLQFANIREHDDLEKQLSSLNTITALQVVFNVPQHSIASIYNKVAKGYFAIEATYSDIDELAVFKDQSLGGEEAFIEVVIKSGFRFRYPLDVAVPKQLTK